MVPALQREDELEPASPQHLRHLLEALRMHLGALPIAGRSVQAENAFRTDAVVAAGVAELELLARREQHLCRGHGEREKLSAKKDSVCFLVAK